MLMKPHERVLLGLYGFLTHPFDANGVGSLLDGLAAISMFADVSLAAYATDMDIDTARPARTENFTDQTGQLLGRYSRARHYHTVTAAIKLTAVSAIINYCNCCQPCSSTAASLAKLVGFYDKTKEGMFRGHIGCWCCRDKPAPQPDSPSLSDEVDSSGGGVPLD